MARISELYALNQKYIEPNLDISYRCILQCPQCARQRLASQSQIKRSFDIEEDNFQKILDYYQGIISLCGQISDPIYHPNFLKLLKICDDRNKSLRISTNGSGKSLEWWEEAYTYGKEKNAWVFGVDGIDKKSELYRIGSNFENVWEMMKLGRSLGHVIIWQYIIFGYNEHEVDNAKEIAKKEDFSLLFIKSDRNFNPNIKNLRKTVKFDSLEPAEQNKSNFVKKEFYGYKSSNWHKWKDSFIKNIQGS